MQQVPDISLADGEEILWTGQTTKIGKTLFNRTDIYLIPFYTFWAAGVFVATIASAGLIKILFTLPFLAIAFILVFLIFNIAGFYFFLGRFIYKYCKYKNTCFVVTNKRLVIKRKRSEKFRHIDIDKIAAEYRLSKKIKKDGRGIIMLTNNAETAAVAKRLGGLERIWNADTYWERGSEFTLRINPWKYWFIYAFVFFYIDNAEEVYRLITGLMAKEQPAQQSTGAITAQNVRLFEEVIS